MILYLKGVVKDWTMTYLKTGYHQRVHQESRHDLERASTPVEIFKEAPVYPD